MRRWCYGCAVPELDPEMVRELAKHAKRELRKRMRALRGALPPSAIAERSRRVAERLIAMPAFESARSIALFWPMDSKHEIDLRAVDQRSRELEKTLFYPFMDPTDDGFRTGFRRVDAASKLADRGRGFLEPPNDAPIASRGDIDLVVVPALAAGSDGHRLGYGVGFYDVTLPDVCPPAKSVTVAFSFQLLAEVPFENWDVACDYVVTDDRIILAERRAGAG
jgi:5-formyltetrahydrofolate cyclo-ligase